MRKLLKTVVTVLLIGTIIVPLNTIEVSACDGYQVVDIQTNGAQTVIGCYSTLDSAKSVMSKYWNGAVKHTKSKSPEKFVAMTRGVAQAYPFRQGSGSSVAETMNIYQHPTSTDSVYKTTYVGSHYELAYFDTYSFNASNGTGKVKVGVAGFEGYANIDQVDLIPMVYLENNLSLYLGGSTYVASYEAAYKANNLKHNTFTVSNGEIRFTSYSYYCSASNPNSCSPIQKANVVIGPKASWMNNGTTYYSWDFVNYYTDKEYKNYAGTYYNYYTYLPFRSVSNITASEFDQYLNSKNKTGSVMIGQGSTFVNNQNTYGVNALLVYAMAIHESAFGTSKIAKEKNNLFGWNAFDSDPGQATTFPSVQQSVLEHMGINLRGYMDLDSVNFFGTHLGNKGSGFNVKYASDPYWGLKISGYAYEIDKMFGLKDYSYYTIGRIDTFGTNIYLNEGSTVAYNSKYGSNYQKDFMVIINNETSSYYQVQSMLGVRSDKSIVTNRENGSIRAAERYTWLYSQFYVKKSDVTKIWTSKYVANGLPNAIAGLVYPKNISLVNTVQSFTVANGKLSITGQAFDQGISLPAANSLNHVLVFTSTTDSSQSKSFNLNDGGVNSGINSVYPTALLDYSYSKYSGSNIDLSSLATGKYEVSMKLNYSIVNFSKSIAIAQLPSVSGSATGTFTIESGKLYYTVAPKSVEKTLVTRIENFEWGTGANSNKLFVQGVSAVSGANHITKGNVTHTLVLVNLETKKEYSYTLTPKNHEEIGTFYYDLGDGGNYYYAWFSEYIDISSLPVGEYTGYLSSKVVDGVTTYYGTKTFLNNKSGGIPEVKVVNSNTIRINKNNKYLQRYEISIEKGTYELFKDVVKPTSRLTNSSMNSFIINNGILSLDGFQFMYNIHHSAENKPSYKLLVVDQNGTIVKEAELATTTGLYDVTPNVDSGHSYTHAWFEGSNIDLTGLEKGTYSIYIVIKNGDYYDVVPYQASSENFKVTGSVNGKTFTLTRNTTLYNRVQLTIK